MFVSVCVVLTQILQTFKRNVYNYLVIVSYNLYKTRISNVNKFSKYSTQTIKLYSAWHDRFKSVEDSSN